MMACSECRWWVSDGKDDSGECRVDSPVMDEEKGRLFPITKPDDFCAEFQPISIGYPGARRAADE